MPLDVDCSKAERDLGMAPWVPDHETYNDMATAMIEMGLVGGGVSGGGSGAFGGGGARLGLAGARIAPAREGNEGGQSS